MSLNITILGLSITSSWGNGHATTYRGLIKALNQRGHAVTFLERDVPWYAAHRDLPQPPDCQTFLYSSVQELQATHADSIRHADLVIVGSYVPEGVPIGQWVTSHAAGLTAFYDIDTPVTLAKLARQDYEYLTPELIRQYDCYLSFTGGPILETLQQTYGSPLACPLYCSVDPDHYFPESTEIKYDLGYLGTYSDDRQPPLQNLMLNAAAQWPAGRFIVAGPQYPQEIHWSKNIERIDHLPPSAHRQFYNQQRFTMNITRADMIRAGYAPSVRLFEAAACGTPIISDYWPGLEEFFRPGTEILLSSNTSETLAYLTEMSEQDRLAIGQAARAQVLKHHTADCRAAELEQFYHQALHTRQQRSAAVIT